MKIDLNELQTSQQAFHAANEDLAKKVQQMQTPIPDLTAAMRLMAEPERNARLSREALERILENQQKQIDENRASGKKSTRLAWIAIIVSIVMTILSIGVPILINIYF